MEPEADCESMSEEFDDDSDDMSDEEGGIRLGEIYIPPGPKPVCSFDSKGPRLMISYIDNYNFKSYYGKQILGPFDPCFNTILGANGSGKSNVIDSLLFVFGYRATKIRSKKVSVLIHRSDKCSEIQSCSVVVHFASVISNGYNHEILKDSEFTIGRTAFVDNSSYYTLNNRRVQFKQISKLLRDYSIDLDHNRFLILQGEVEQISLMKPKGETENETGLLEFLEDIIGTTRFKTPITQLRDKLEELNVERTEKANNMKAAQKDRAELEGPKEEVIAFLKLENEIAKFTNQLMQKYIKENQQLIDLKEQEKAELVANMKGKIGEMKEIQQEKKLVIDQIRGINKEVDMLVIEKNKLNIQFKAYDNEDAGLQAEVDAAKKTIAETNELIAEEKKKLAGFERQPDRFKGDVEGLAKQEKQLLEECALKDAELKEVLENLAGDTEDLCNEQNVLEKQLAELQKNVDEKKSEYEIAKSELDVYVLPEKHENQKLKDMNKALKETKETLEEKKVEEKETLKKIGIIEKNMTQMTIERDNLESEDQMQAKELRDLRIKLDEANSSLSSAQFSNKIVQYLMQCKAKGDVPGLFGRLGDLGAINKKYDVAISTACGQLDNIVVDTVKTAQKCIELLRRANVGYASFIALERQEKFREACDNPPKTPENTPRLVDLIKLKDERVRVAFYFALRDTLVAENVAHASRIATAGRRFRVVTIQGNIVEITGAMVGGGRHVRKGRMGEKVAVHSTSVSQETVEDLQKKMLNCQHKLQTIAEKKEELERKISCAAADMRKSTTELQKIRSALKALVEELPSLEKEVKKQEQVTLNVASCPAKVTALTAVVQKAKVAYDDALAAARKITVKVDAIKAEIEKKFHSKVNTARKNVDDTKKRLTKKRQDIGKVNGFLKTAERNAEKCRQNIEEMEKEIKQAEDYIAECRGKKDGIEDLAQVVVMRVKIVIDEIIERESKISKFQQEVEHIEKLEYQKRGEVQEFESDIDVKQRTIADYKGKFPGMKKTMKALKMNLILGQPVSLTLPTYTDEQIAGFSVTDLQYKLAVLEGQLPKEKPDLTILEEYQAKEKLFLERFGELEEVRKLQEKAFFLYDEARKQRVMEFMTGYTIITRKLKELYQMITLGGDAEFELVDSLDPFTEGIVFSVRPPQKSWKNISNLSGGEKTLSSLALIFALHFYKPSPLFVMDEIDAALDFKNVSIVGNYIKNRTKNSQFIVISLRSNMFELADRLMGIFKVSDCTQSVTVNPDLYAIPSSTRRELREDEIEYEIIEDENEEREKDEDGLLDLPNNRKPLKRRIKVKKVGDDCPVSLQNVLQTAFTQMMKEVEKSNPIIPTKEEIEERIRRRSGVDLNQARDAYAAMMEELTVKKTNRKRESKDDKNHSAKKQRKMADYDVAFRKRKKIIKDENTYGKENEPIDFGVKEEIPE